MDLSAHRVLIELATTAEGKVRVVTTNFDRLFEACGEGLKVWQPPRLPDPSRPNDMDGVVHLHGRVAMDYGGPEGEGFVLSSSEFGRAYLSDGWATDFFKEVVERYVVVFVGYAAEDPPVQYLLEALNKTAGRLDGVYAFQNGTPSEASARWRHKGIEAIPYSDDGTHRSLWETLEAWAGRATAPESWFKSVIELAKKGPSRLQPHERGQVAHIVSTAEGARRFSEGDSPPNSEWLCVFDPHQRYAKPGPAEWGDLGPVINPFDLYGLDSDPVPSAIDPKDYYTKRDVPGTAWDAFAANKLDRQNLRDDTLSTLRGHWATTPPRLSSRLGQIGLWLARVAHQPAAVWWASHQSGIHPDIQRQIQWQLERSRDVLSPEVFRAWRYLFEAWEHKQDDLHRDWFELKGAVAKGGWDSAAVRRYGSIDRPYITVGQVYGSRPTPPEIKDGIRLGNLVRVDVEYPNLPNGLIIPDEWLASAISELRKNLECAIQLESELGGFGLSVGPIVAAGGDDDRYSRTHGLGGSVFRIRITLRPVT